MSMGKRGRPNRRIRLEEIAEHCKVSVSTASRALSGAGGVRGELREQILAAARALNYAIPASLADRKVLLAASSVAMVDSARSQFTFHVLDGLNERARAIGVEIITRPVASKDDELALLREAEADADLVGCLFLTLDDAAVLTLAGGFSKPIVLVNGDDPGMRALRLREQKGGAKRLAGARAADDERMPDRPLSRLARQVELLCLGKGAV